MADKGLHLLAAVVLVALAVYLPAGIVLSGALRIFFDKFHRQALNFAAAAILVFLMLMSVAPPQRLYGLAIYGAVNGVGALAAGAGAAFLVARLPRAGPGKIALLAAVGYLLAISCLAFSLAWIVGSGIRFLLKPALSLMAALAFAGVFLFFHRGVLKGRVKAAALVAAAAVIVGFASPLAAWHTRIPLSGDAGARASDRAPHVIFIVADALRYDALSPERTPNLWKLMEEGVYLTSLQAAAPWTVPAMVGMFSARDPERARAGGAYRVPSEVPIISEQLWERGYRTVGLCANVVMHPDIGILRGYQRLEIMHHMDPVGDLNLMPIFAFVDHYSRKALHRPLVPDLTPAITEKAIDEIKNADGPLFLYLHYMDPHDPYSPPPAFMPPRENTGFGPIFHPRNSWHVKNDYRDPQLADLREGYLRLSAADKKFIAGLYFGEVAYLDHHLARLFAAVREARESSERPVLVIFVSDHGEELWDHDDWGHGQNLYQELLHIPLVLWGDEVPAGGRIDAPLSQLSIMETLRQALGLPPDPGAQGKSFWDAVKQGTEPAPDPVVFSSQTFYYHNLAALRAGEDKIIHNRDTGDFTYFNIALDPEEEFGQDARMTGQALPLIQALTAWETLGRETSFHLQVTDPDLKRSAEQRLHAVGYLQ